MHPRTTLATRLGVVCCLLWSVGAGAEPTAPGANNLLISAVAWKQTAAEYGALYHQGFNVARLHLDAALARRRAGDRPLAIVTDVDDTVLLPLDYWGHLITNGHDFFDDAIWDAWVPENRFVAAPGAKAFLDHAAANGVDVFYVSSRDQGEGTLDYLLGNLRAVGFPNVEPAFVTALRDSSNKEPRQQEIMATHDVVVFLGDNLNDFARRYYVKDVDERLTLMEEDRALFGHRLIVFPNPTDGHWVRAIFGESEPPPSDENRTRFKEAATRRAW